MKSLFRSILAVLAILACAADAAAATYTNPILFADYSDPDAIRVGQDYYLVASSFHFSPGLPILKSHDLAHWTIVGHALAKLPFAPEYDLPGPVAMSESWNGTPPRDAVGQRYGEGVWAPAMREHGGKFYIYFATPREGIFMVSAPRPEGPWSAPVAVIAEPLLEDPCPFWDDDGKAYLIHSRKGAGPLILHRMSEDGTHVLDSGKTIVQDPVKLPTLEGPKLYKRNGYYTIFAPFGGVGRGPQAVFRSRSIDGPYEWRVVLERGNTDIAAPHQGAWVETPSGQGWFLHFNSTGAYGRIVHLQPLRWVDDWPVIGEPIPGKQSGQPVASYAMPDVGGSFAPMQLQDTDEFDSATLGPQWEWNHNPDDSHWSLSARPGYLRLSATPARDLLSARNTLTQILQGATSDFTVRLEVGRMADGQRAGIAMLQQGPNWIGVVQEDGARRLAMSDAGVETVGPTLEDAAVRLRVHVEREQAFYSYSLDEGRHFLVLGKPVQLRFSWWKGARPALFSFTRKLEAPAGDADFDWVHVERR